MIVRPVVRRGEARKKKTGGGPRKDIIGRPFYMPKAGSAQYILGRENKEGFQKSIQALEFSLYCGAAMGALCLQDLTNSTKIFMQTYSAALAPWRMVALHPKYVERAQFHANLIIRNGGAVRDYKECMCPYCGKGDRLAGTVKLGAKEHVYDVQVTAEGFTAPGARNRTAELLVLYCQHEDCKAVIDPLAYYSPATFYLDKENKSLLPSPE